MALPKIDKPVTNLKIPSTGQQAPFRMMTRREEKILLVAKETKDVADWLMSIMQVVRNCCVASDLIIENLASFDVEYLFIRLRAMSINPTQKLTYHDHNDDKDYVVDVDLEKIDVVFPKDTKPTIELNGGTVLQMRWPPVSTWVNKKIIDTENAEDALDELVASCVEKIWSGNNVHDAKTTSHQELIEFLDTLDVSAWDKIREYVSNTPHLSYFVGWTNSKGEERKFELRTLADFFPFSVIR